jgi:plasmid stabilization system protein ParE
MRLRYTRRAQRHIDGIHGYIAERNPDAARRVIQRIRATADLLQEFPLAGHAGLVTGTREMIVVGLPYVIVHRIDPRGGGVLEILGIYHMAQDRARHIRDSNE